MSLLIRSTEPPANIGEKIGGRFARRCVTYICGTRLSAGGHHLFRPTPLLRPLATRLSRWAGQVEPVLRERGELVLERRGRRHHRCGTCHWPHRRERRHPLQTALILQVIAFDER